MSYFLILCVLLVQSYLLKSRLCVPLAGYRALFFDTNNLLTALPQLPRFLIWLFVPLLIFSALDSYGSSEISLAVSLLMHFVVLLGAFGFAEVKQAIKDAQAKKQLASPQCLFLSDTINVVDSNFYIIAVMAFRCLFCVLFFSYLFAGYGALVVMLTYAFALRDPTSAGLLRLVTVLEWMPLRLLYFTLALDNNVSALPQVAKSLTNATPSEKLIADCIVRDIFEQNSHNKTVKLKRLWLRQLAIWLVTMAVIYLAYLLVS